MTGLASRAIRAIQWRANVLLGTGASKPDGPVNSFSATDVSDYYDTFTPAYLKATGPFLQAFRGKDTDALMEYYAARWNIADGMHILDAGCGVGAPAIWLARKFPNLTVEGLTISPVQAEAAMQAVTDANLGERVTVRQGDYHELSDYYAHNRFDRVLFLESLGHSDNVAKVLYGVRDVLKQGGLVCIKDFFQRRSRDPDWQARIDDAVATINANYCYHVMQLPSLIAACMETGFRIASVAPPAIEPDLKLTIDFEHETGRLTYPAYARFPAVDWYEVVGERE